MRNAWEPFDENKMTCSTGACKWANSRCGNFFFNSRAKSDIATVCRHLAYSAPRNAGGPRHGGADPGLHHSPS